MLRATTTVATTARSMACLVAAAFAATATLSAPARATEPSLVVLDAKNDVRFHRAYTTPPPAAERRSIDIREVVVTARSNGTTRISVTIAKALRTRDFDQMVSMTIKAPEWQDNGWVSASLGWSPQKPRKWSYASVDLGDAGYENCTAKRIHTRFAANTLSADFPNRCIPVGSGNIKIWTGTGSFRTDATPFSTDVAKAGLQALR